MALLPPYKCYRTLYFTIDSIIALFTIVHMHEEVTKITLYNHNDKHNVEKFMMVLYIMYESGNERFYTTDTMSLEIRLIIACNISN